MQTDSQCGPAGPQPNPELEDDLAELVCFLADERIDNVVMCNGAGPTEGGKQQFRDALEKLIDERIKAALSNEPLRRINP